VADESNTLSLPPGLSAIEAAALPGVEGQMGGRRPERNGRSPPTMKQQTNGVSMKYPQYIGKGRPLYGTSCVVTWQNCKEM